MLTSINKDSFIGDSFETPRGGIYKIIGDNGLKGNKKKYKGYCSICSEDSELFPDKYFFSPKSSLKGGGVPCGCSFAPKWEPFQYKILCERLLSGTDVTFKGFFGEFKGAKTKLKLHCPVHGETTTNIFNNIKRGTYCPSCGLDNKHLKRRDDIKTVRLFKEKSNYPAGTIFRPLKEKLDSNGWRPYWKITCSRCMDVKDPENNFVVSSRTNILSGKISCSCKINIFGYYGKRLKEEDNLYILKLTSEVESFIKIGRSFTLNKRIRELEKTGYKVDIIETAKGVHEDIFKLEQKILCDMSEYKYTPLKGFGGDSECLDVKILEDIIKLVKRSYKC